MYITFSLNIEKFVGGEDYVFENFTEIFENMEHEKEILLRIIDDNLVEYHETYTLAINITGHHHILAGENSTANVTIYDDDGK